jgi:hypothetical protein
VYSYYYLIYYSLDQSPLRIDHVGYYKGPNPLLRIGQKIIVIGRNKKSAPKDIKEAPKYNKDGYNHLVGEVGPASEETLHTCRSCINKEVGASLRHTTHLLIERQVSDLQLDKKEREWRIFGRGSSVLV